MRVAEHTRSRSGTSQPISQHPLFPAIVALWFAALFGLGSLAIRPALVEHLVIASGIDRVIPMATPPLGATARILIALALTGLGGVVGALIGRRVASPATAPQERQRGTSRLRTVRQPAIEPEAETPAPSGAPSGRRRSLSPKPVLSDPDLAEATEPRILDVADLDLSHFDEDIVEAPLRQRETARGAFVTPSRQVSESADSELEASEQADEEVAPVENRLFEEYARSLPASEENEVEVRPASEPAAAPGFVLLPEASLTAPITQAVVVAPAAEMGEPDRDTLDSDPATVTADVDMAQSDTPFAPFVASSLTDHVTAADRIATAELAELSPVQLLERLALAMERRREAARLVAAAPVPQPEPDAFVAPADLSPAAPAPAPMAVLDEPEDEPNTSAPPFAAPLTFERLSLRPVALAPEIAARESDASVAEELSVGAADVNEPEREEPAPPAPFAAPALPAALRPVALHQDEDDLDDPLPGYVPPRHIGLAAAAGFRAPHQVESAWQGGEDRVSTGEDDDGDEEDEALDQGYSSLLNLSRPTGPRQAFVRIEEPEDSGEIEPMVVFPGSEEADSAPFARPAAAHADLTQAPTNGPAPRLFDAPGRGDADDTERALRAALATLQRMSGAA